jgi:DNA-binding IclR family transcriptional regulator
MTEASEKTERLIASVERAVAVLRVLADAPSDLGTNEIARRSGTNASTVSRLLATLAKDDLVARVPHSGRYRLGLRMIQLGHAALSRVDIRDAVRPHLIALTEITGETATLSVPGQESTMTVDFVQSPSSVRSVAALGRPGVPHATSIGKVFLAYGGRLPPGPLPALTDRTVVSRAQLAKELAVVRNRGWAEARGEREADLNAVAAPILDHRGELAAVLGVQGPASRFDDTAMRAAADRLLERAAQLSSGFGLTKPGDTL